MPNGETLQFNGIGIRLITTTDYLAVRPKQFVAVISEPTFLPGHWGKDPPRNRFNPSDLASQLSGEGYRTADFRRSNAPKWSGQFGPFLGYCNFDPPLSDKWLPDVFSWADTLAEVIQPEFGVCHPIFPQKNASVSNTCAVIGPELGEYGLPRLGGRTYLGDAMVRRIGLDLLRSTAAVIREREWGVVIDLLPERWTTDPESLLARQTEVMQMLVRCGMFADYRNFLAPQVAPKWVPFEI